MKGQPDYNRGYEEKLDLLEQRFADELSKWDVDRLDDRVVVDYHGTKAQITAKNVCIVGGVGCKDEIAALVAEALEPQHDPYPSVAKQQLEGYQYCDSCSELKESPERFAISETQDDGGSVNICWDCHNNGRTVQ